MQDFFTKENVIKIIIYTLICLAVWAILDYLWSTFIDHTAYDFVSSIKKDVVLALITGGLMTYAANSSKKS